MEANKKKKVKKEYIWTADANSDVSDSQLNDSDETQVVYKQFNIHFKSVRLVYIYTQAQIHSLKFDSSALAFVCFEISTLLKLEISKQTNAKADESN